MILTTTIDEFFNENNIQRIDFIKVDVEGAEEKVLEGAMSVLRKLSTKIFLSIHSEKNYKECKKLLDDLGYKYKNLGSDLFCWRE